MLANFHGSGAIVSNQTGRVADSGPEGCDLARYPSLMGPPDDPILLLPREPDWAGPRHPPRARRAQVNVGGTSTDPRFSSVEASLVTDATALGRDRIKPNSVWAAA